MKITKRSVWLVVDGSRIVANGNDFVTCLMTASKLGVELYAAERVETLLPKTTKRLMKQKPKRIRKSA